MHRFFLSPAQIREDKVVITGKQAHQIQEVLRLNNGDQVAAFDGTGREYVIRILDIKLKRVVGEVTDQCFSVKEPRIRVTLYQALLKSDKFEFVLQKCTEIGIARFVPILCERCVASSPGQTKQARWGKIITEAAEQSGRVMIPILTEVIGFEQACSEVGGLSLIPWEKESGPGIRSVLQDNVDAEHVSIFIGPEGGFTHGEIDVARGNGVIPVTLGKRILRADTAGLVAASVVLYEFGEME